MNISKLNRAALENLDREEREGVLQESSAALTERIIGAPDFEREVDVVVEELRLLGHDLRLFDADFDVDFDKNETSQLWCGDWAGAEGRGTPLIVTFHSTKGVELEWSEPV